MAKRWLLAKKWSIVMIMSGLVVGLLAGSYLPNLKALNLATQLGMSQPQGLPCDSTNISAYLDQTFESNMKVAVDQSAYATVVAGSKAFYDNDITSPPPIWQQIAQGNTGSQMSSNTETNNIKDNPLYKSVLSIPKVYAENAPLTITGKSAT